MKKTDSEKYLIAFGMQLKKLRKKQGFTQESLAYESGIELRQIGRIERGEINTGILSIKIIADTLDIDKRELLNF